MHTYLCNLCRWDPILLTFVIEMTLFIERNFDSLKATILVSARDDDQSNNERAENRLPSQQSKLRSRTFSEIRQETAKGLIVANAEWLTGCVYI